MREILGVEAALEYAKEEIDNKEFTYRGYKCEINRVMPMGHLCGYIIKTSEYIDNDILDDVFHCGITYDEEDKVGFDCAHIGGYISF